MSVSTFLELAQMIAVCRGQEKVFLKHKQSSLSVNCKLIERTMSSCCSSSGCSTCTYVPRVRSDACCMIRDGCGDTSATSMAIFYVKSQSGIVEGNCGRTAHTRFAAANMQFMMDAYWLASSGATDMTRSRGMSSCPFSVNR